MNLRTLALACPLALTACGGSGTLSLTTYGEDFIEVGMPAASEADPEGVVDGWSIKYDSFLVVLSDVWLEEGGVEVVGRPEARVFDLTRPGPHAVADFDAVPSGTYPSLTASIRPAAPTAGNADAAAVTRMREAGWSVYAEGRATRGADSKAFAWGFDTATRYYDCVDADDKPGVVVPNGGAARAQLTIHGDHLFFDDLQSADAVLRFDAIADADADADGVVTLAELAEVELSQLPPDRYGTGGDSRLQDLAAFVTAQTRSLLHFQGEGHCQTQAL